VRGLLRSCPIVPCRDGSLRGAMEACWADEETVVAFGGLGREIPFVALIPDGGPALARLCRPFDVEAALEYLEAAARTDATQWNRAVPWVTVLAWFEGRRDQVLSRESFIKRLRDLPLFPSASGLLTLSKLAVQVDLVDPLV